MYVCPKCKGSLHEYRCPNCQIQFPVVEGIPCFMTASAGSSDRKLREIYDEIYLRVENLWVDQGRTENFLSYFRDLIPCSPADRVLEIGCGEGSLLEALTGSVKVGIDPSLRALMRAKRRVGAEWAVARAEELPFRMDYFDRVVSVGVMEHLEDPTAANAEIRRVLKPSGYYLALIQTDQSVLERLVVKWRMYVFPRFRPLALLRWVINRLRHRIVQPLRRSYTIETAQQCLTQSGLDVTQVITRKSHPSAPLAGDHVVILVARPHAEADTAI
jgi:ubiquinone/menaquinone biosynthesis C-methylase UbiE